ncbi:4Fe-4S binding protein [Adlercreutzia sp. DFI.6.23]|uniref:4Fe-4S binding protein n=1 Tax=Adlercreutzia sp. DFI.6.23 TaxID=2963705 RepID=UPI0035231634
MAAILLLGRAFCGWLCPVPVWSKLRGIFKMGGTSTAGAASGISSAPDAAPGISSVGGDLGRPSATAATSAAPATKATPLSAAEKRALKTSCAGGCSSCADRKPADSRHIILGGTPAFRRHLRIPGILPGMPRGSVVRHGVSAYRAIRRRRCHLVGAHHPGADSRRGDLLP